MPPDPLGVDDDGSILSQIRGAVGTAIDEVGGGGLSIEEQLRTEGYTEIAPGLWLHPTSGNYRETVPGAYDRATGGGSAGPRGPTQAELDLDSRALDLEQRGQDIAVQIADADRALDALELQLQAARDERDAAVADGLLDVAEARETRIAEIERERVQIEHDRFGLDQQRFGLQESIFALDKERFQVEQGQFQQTFGLSMQEFLNNQLLGQQGIAINAAALGIDAQGNAASSVLGAGSLLGSLGADLGDLEFRRDELLSKLISNPRDFVQLNRELGGGTSFLEQLGLGESVTGQSTRLIGEQTLGPAWDALAASLMQRPELEFFEQARERAGDIPTFEELAGIPATNPFFPEGPPEPALGFTDPATVGAGDAGLLPDPVPNPVTDPVADPIAAVSGLNTEPLLGGTGIVAPYTLPGSSATGPIPEPVAEVISTFNDPNAVGAETGGPTTLLDILAAMRAL